MRKPLEILIITSITSIILLTGCSIGKEEQTIQHNDSEQLLSTQTNGPKFYVPSEQDDIISIIDLPSNHILGKIKTGDRPANLAFVPELGKAFVTHLDDKSVGVIDLKNLNITKKIKVGILPHGLALSENHSQLFVTTIGDQYVYVIDTHKEKVSRKINLGSKARTNYPFLYDNRLYVTDHENHLVYVVENDQVVDTYKVSAKPMVCRTSTDGTLLYVASSSYKAIEVFDTKSGKKVDEIKSGDGVTDFVISDKKSILISTNKEENSVSIINLNTNRIIKKLKNLPAPKHISFNEDETKVYFTVSGTNKVVAIEIDTLEISDEIKVGRSPHGIQLNNN
jgi:YVTN family beta-propeller protein